MQAMSNTRKCGVLGVLVLVLLLSLLLTAGTASAGGQAYGPHEWNAVWYPPNELISEVPFSFALPVMMDDPLGTGKVTYRAVLTLTDEYVDPKTGYYHAIFQYDFYKDGVLAWHCSDADHYVKDLDARLAQRFAAPEVAYGQGAYAGWEAHLISGFSGAGTSIWAMKGYFVGQ
jgi:hypothetical protein